jgi:uncharacterized protein (TIGR00725 family)
VAATHPPYIAVVGAGVATEAEARIAREVGRLLGRRGAVLVCGGMTGVMKEACRGARELEGTTVGLLPGHDREGANPYVTVALPTGLGEMRNALIVRAVDAVIAISGEYGTLSEIAFALKTGVPVVGIDTWRLDQDRAPAPGVEHAASAAEAVTRALERAGSRRDRSTSAPP